MFCTLDLSYPRFSCWSSNPPNKGYRTCPVPLILATPDFLGAHKGCRTLGCRDVYKHDDISSIAIDLSVNLAIDPSIDVAIDLPVDLCFDLAIDLSIDLAIDLSVDLDIDLAARMRYETLGYAGIRKDTLGYARIR